MDDLDKVQQIVNQMTDVVYSRGRELPRVRRNFRQLMEEGDELWARHAGQDVSESDGIAFLGARGVDLLSAKRALESLSQVPVVEKPAEATMFDVPSVLARAKERIVLDLLEETASKVEADCGIAFRRAADDAWDRLKNEILESEEDVGGGVGDDYSFLASAARPTMNVTMKSEVDSVGAKFARRVADHNKETISGKFTSGLLEKFMDAVNEMKSPTVKNRWDLVYSYKKLITKGNRLDADPAIYRAKPEAIDELIYIGRTYLEEKYARHLERAVWNNMQSVELRGRAGNFEMIRNYWRTVVAPTASRTSSGQFGEPKDVLVADVPAWAFLYYAIRCGDMTTAKEVADNAGLVLAEVRPYLDELRASKYRRLSPESEAKLRLTYRRDHVHSQDPYKKLVLCLLGACDFVENHSSICIHTEDYMWTKLCQLRGRPSEASGKPISSSTFADFQKLIVEDFGEAYFNASKNPDLYFMVLMLTGQFERALEFLYRLDGTLKTEAVHMGLGLLDLDLLRVTKSTKRNILDKNPDDAPGVIRLNLARMVILYAKKFYKTNCMEALHYYYQLIDFESAGENAFYRLTSDLVLEVGNPDYFFGKLMGDWNRTPGALDEFHLDTEKIISKVADELAFRADIADSVSLLLLCQREDDGLELLLKHLSALAVLKPGSSGTLVVKREELIRQGKGIMAFIREKGRRNASPYLVGALDALMRVVEFFDLFHELKMQPALDMLESLGLIPMNSSDVDKYAQNFNQVHSGLQKLLPELLMASMNILFQLYNAARSQAEAARTSVAHPRGAREFQTKAAAVSAFAGIMSNHVPVDVIMQIMQTAGLMS